MKTKKKVVKNVVKKPSKKNKKLTPLQRILKEMKEKPENQVDVIKQESFDCETEIELKFEEDIRRTMEIPSVNLTVSFNDGSVKLCIFDFFEQCVPDNHKSTFIAECNGIHGGGQNWAMALARCIDNMALEGMLVF